MKNFNMDKKMIIRNFSRHAYTYDRYADIQNLAALRLLEDLDGEVFGRILEVGCGTGNYTFLLRDKFRPAKLKAIDISGRMIEVARKKLNGRQVDFLVADAEKLNVAENFDCITSNACFQWFDDLGEALRNYKRLLRKGGTILFSVFGPATFRELNISLRSILEKPSPGINKFMDKERLKDVLNQNFKRVRIEEARYEEIFMHLQDLLRKIKYSGISTGALKGKVPFSRRFLSRLEKTYLDKFRRIKASYQVFFCRGINA